MDIAVGDLVWLAFVNTYGGDVQGHVFEKEIAAVYKGRPTMEFHLSAERERLTEEPSLSMTHGNYFPTEAEARRWLAEELRRRGRAAAERFEAVAAEQDRLVGNLEAASRGVVTV